MILEYKKDSKEFKMLLSTLKLGYTKRKDYTLNYEDETVEVHIKSYTPEYIYLVGDGFQIKLDYEEGSDGLYSGVSQAEGEVYPQILIPLQKGDLISRCLTRLSFTHTWEGSPVDVTFLGLRGAGDEEEEMSPPPPLSKLQWVTVIALSAVSTACTLLIYECLPL